MNASKLQQTLDTEELRKKVKSVYRDVATDPHGEYHFETGRKLAEKLGYKSDMLNAVPRSSVESFAGVGYFFDLAGIKKGEKVLDLGSGSGMDSFIASLETGPDGSVTGIDMTEEQCEKAERLSKNEFDLKNISFKKGDIASPDFDDDTFDLVISNGVINLAHDKKQVFSEIARVLKAGGRMVIADIVSEQQMPEKIVCDSTLWASCIGGAAYEETYTNEIENSGFRIKDVRKNKEYKFLSKSAVNASDKYGVKSISFLSVKE